MLLPQVAWTQLLPQVASDEGRNYVTTFDGAYLASRLTA